MSTADLVAAKVTGIYPSTHGGHYVATMPIGPDSEKFEGSITFDKRHWREKEQLLQEGLHVILECLTKKEGGWRADKARPFMVGDII